MKRLTAVFFLILFLMYHVGYLGYYWYGMKQINDQWLVHVEVTPDMKHITIPITLPYWTETDYRPAHGSITIKGKQYRTVMEKYGKDAIHLIVAEDHAAQHLDASISDWIKMMNATDSEKSGKADLLKSIAKDYLSQNHLESPGDVFTFLDHSYSHFDDPLPSRVKDVNTPPPQV